MHEFCVIYPSDVLVFYDMNFLPFVLFSCICLMFILIIITITHIKCI